MTRLFCAGTLLATCLTGFGFERDIGADNYTVSEKSQQFGAIGSWNCFYGDLDSANGWTLNVYSRSFAFSA